MVFRSKYFDDLVTSIKAGTISPTALHIGGFITIKGQYLFLERELSENQRLLKSLARLAPEKKARYFYNNSGSPARRIRGPLCLLVLLDHGRLIDLFFVETPPGYCIVAVYSDASKEAFELIDDLQQVPFGVPEQLTTAC